jgi:outer membrane lipoprotein LolB
MMRKAWCLWSILFATLLIAGCAGSITAREPISLKNPAENGSAEPRSFFAGRISLVIDAAPNAESNAANAAAQSFSGSFEWRGNAQTGQLDLLSPLGGIVAQMQWSPSSAQLSSGGVQRSFPTAASMIEQTTGVQITPEQLLHWLQGRDTPRTNTATDWQLDLSRYSQGRISAQRQQPTPAQLRIILEQP